MRLTDLATIPGNLPGWRVPLPPCRYSARCEGHTARCDTIPLQRLETSAGHAALPALDY